MSRNGVTLKFFKNRIADSKSKVEKSGKTNSVKTYKSDIKRLVRVESSEPEDIEVDDTVALLRGNGVVAGLKVKSSGGRLYAAITTRYDDERVYLDELDSTGYSIESISRYVSDESYNYTPKADELDKTRPGVRLGSRASLEQALEAADFITVYFENRMAVGDPLFDQWMVDALDSSRAASENLKKTIEALHGDSE